ncbi:hypothetical protein J5069_07595 [Candidatus Symbiopectobacterium sp. NZEC127]|uniref:hypothetical protein n=1 Tax=Candidatus Symbiopectobacterium sp. NZEC127 TaxID=2820472 RepID=UPI0022279B5A|nr:hypothetical protein [Candidatus Symbiopectobacterium sp. NZEC127]MCW2485760.1 hypothetical protein [Candidatus Symbiopectobacterium sp. NZEC127]
MANKKELSVLEKVFTCEIRGVAFQSKSNLVAKLVADGLLEYRKESEQSPFGLMTWEHYVLTHAGRIAYGASCGDAEVNGA